MQTIGRYHIEGELGKGAMGVVYKATDPNIGRKVALKTMRLDVHGIEAEEMLQRFRNEARSAGVLNHPNIVTIYDAGEADGLFYMAMEIIEGDTLQQLLQKSRVLPVEQIIKICSQVGAGLDYAHARGVIHRDIKPANIMITTSGLVKIMDFGIAKAGGGLTSTGQVLGTPNYMSPEQVKGKPLDGRTDLFSLGVVLYEMLTGEKPFASQNVTTIIYKIVHEEPIEPRCIDDSIHPGLNAIVARALSKATETRYQSGADLAKDLENYKSLGPEATQSIDTAVVTNATEIARAAAATTVQSPTIAAAPQASPVAVSQAVAKASAAGPATVRRARPGRSNKRLLWGGVVALVGLLAFASVLILNRRKQPPIAAAAENSGAAKPSVSTPVQLAAPGRASQPAAVAAANTTTGELVITTKPENALVKLDGKRLAGSSPLTQKDLAPGSHTIQVSATGYAAVSRSIDVVAGSSATVDVALVPTTGIVKIGSTPPGATIFVDGVLTKKTTPSEFNLAKGDHTFMVRLEGYDEAGDLIEVEPGQTIAFAPKLTSRQGNPFRKMGRIFGGEDKGQLSVTTTPQGAFVFVNGRRVPRQTPFTVPVPVGRFFLAIRKPGYRPVQRALEIEKGRTTTINTSLTPKGE